MMVATVCRGNLAAIARRRFSHISNTRLSRKLDARGANVHVEQLNPCAPHQILCLAGSLGTASTDFSVQLNTGLDNCAADKFGFVAIDPRGLSESSVTSSGRALAREYLPDFYLQDALDGADVMSELGYEKYSVMGWLDGANAAIHLAAHPDTKESINKLVIWGGNAY